MDAIRYALLSALLSPLVNDDDDVEQEPGAPATGESAAPEQTADLP
ncbi:MAG: hypothetical protein H6841_06520 [Planctomycetes bacterium]|nr:hypothetical protein [Planctomycetota bacterium]MCB9936201.1 hypothetical protein [Planctomycetota bacterium]